MATKQLKTHEILIVEDSQADVIFTREAFSQSKHIQAIYAVDNGVDAMLYLRQEGLYSQARRPDLIILDLNLPRKNGFEVLREIKTDPDLRSIPVIVFTTSKAKEEILKAYALQANSYIVKPVEFSHFSKMVQSIEHYWFRDVTLPSEV